MVSRHRFAREANESTHAAVMRVTPETRSSQLRSPALVVAPEVVMKSVSIVRWRGRIVALMQAALG